MLRGPAFVALVALLAVGACKKSVEEERESWATNTAAVQQLVTLYPSFQAPLEARLAKATTIYESAEGLGEEQAAEKMDEANETLMGGFVGRLKGLDRRVKDLRSKLVDAATASGDEADRLGVRVVATNAERTLVAVDAAIEAGAADMAAAEIVLGKIDGDLRSVERDLRKVLSAASRKKSEARKAAKAGKDEAKKAATKKEAAKVPWKCEYCGSRNDAKLTKCPGCGASRK